MRIRYANNNDYYMIYTRPGVIYSMLLTGKIKNITNTKLLIYTDSNEEKYVHIFNLFFFSILDALILSLTDNRGEAFFNLSGSRRLDFLAFILRLIKYAYNSIVWAILKYPSFLTR